MAQNQTTDPDIQVNKTKKVKKQSIKIKEITVTNKFVPAEIGSSTISQQEIKRRTVNNDLSELIKTQAGVALISGSSSGQYGNKRQISLRGMGPENTLVLIDGRPVLSRNAVRMGWRGDRNTRGDTNWVPAEMVESIRIIRGPAATRYGNGAAGGVVEITTKKPTKQWTGSSSMTYFSPQDSKEGKGQRFNFNIMGPITNKLLLRLYANHTRTNADSWDINRPYEPDRTPLYHEQFCDFSGLKCGNGWHSYAKTFTPGREGVINQDANLLLQWKLAEQHTIDFELGYSKQSNLYNGESAFNNVQKSDIVIDGTVDPKYKDYYGKTVYYMGTDVAELLDTSTERTERITYAINHSGSWGNITNNNVFQLETTKINKLLQGIMGGSEGSALTDDRVDQRPNLVRTGSDLNNITVKSEWILPLKYKKIDNLLLLGFEYNHSKLNNAESMSQKLEDLRYSFNVPGYDPDQVRSPTISSTLWSVYLESQTDFGQGTSIKPSIRYDHHSRTKAMFSPAISLQHDLNNQISITAGIGQSYKAPNLFQINPDYLLYSRGNGCFHWNPILTMSGVEYVKYPCFLQGFDQLLPESSINSELGISYNNDWLSTAFSYFKNDYRNKIEAGTKRRDSSATYLPNGQLDLWPIDIYKWTNVRKAIIDGIEATINFNLPYNIEWRNNFTYMHRFDVLDKNWDNALLIQRTKNIEAPDQRYDIIAILPKYTFNTSLSWQATDNWLFSLSGNFYGKQMPPKLSDDNLADFQFKRHNGRAAYSTFDFATHYQFNKYLTIIGGIKNITNKRQYRLGNTNDTIKGWSEGKKNQLLGGAGGNTYNEPGRQFYLGINASF